MSVIHPDITVGPPMIAINNGFTVMTADPDGQISEGTEKGLFFRDTRMISSYTLGICGEPWELLNAAAITHYGARVFLTNPKLSDEEGEIPAHSIGLVIGRSLGEGLHEDYDLTNYGMRAVRLVLELQIHSDFADIFEVRKQQRVRRGDTQTRWSPGDGCLATIYSNESFRRGHIVRVHKTDSPVTFANGRLAFNIEIGAGGSWHACVVHTFQDGDTETKAPPHCIEDAEKADSGRHMDAWTGMATKLESSNEEFYRLYRRGVEDIAALRLPSDEKTGMSFVPAGGTPWFAALFGRDSLIASLQALQLFPDFARGTLETLAQSQARERDDYRDAEPGKIAHEMRQGELAQLGKIPHTPYYGTADATPLYLILLHEAWRWTGDASLVSQHLDTAERCLEWIDRYGDRDGDGFQEYGTRSDDGYENQGWKDAGDAIPYPDGSLVKSPKALCELQGYVYDAWVRMAEVYESLGRTDRAGELRAKAAALFERFNKAFWDDELGFYALGLDANKKPIRTIASNAGHCLWSGIVPPDRAAKVVARLMAPDMWSGWGVRTLSADHPAFNPNSYHTGSVWPHDNAIIAMGFKRYGYTNEAALIARSLSEAASYFALQRLPELFAGAKRAPTSFPVQYLGANVPQAWSAGAVFFLTSALLGLEADAPRGKLYVDPVLPEWMPDVTLKDLTMGGSKLTLRFTREGESAKVEVAAGDAALVERRPMSERPAILAGGEAASPQTIGAAFARIFRAPVSPA